MPALMMDTIARTGSFAAAARELGKVPSALTYSVRQLEEALDVLLFDRSSRQAQLTAAGSELLHEGRRLLQEMDAVANRVRRVASGWETQLSISVEDILSAPTIFELVQAFCRCASMQGRSVHEGPATRLRLRTDVLAGTWEALVSGQVDLAIGVERRIRQPRRHRSAALGRTALCLLRGAAPPAGRGAGAAGRRAAGAPPRRGRGRYGAAHDTHHGEPAAGAGRADGASMRAKLEALLRGLGSGFVPEPLARAQIEAGRLVQKETARSVPVARLHYAWRAERSALGLGRALQWWLAQLESPTTRRALLERHGGLLP
jgi:DNA-binding transcriptional LysR family regulator